MLNESKLDTSFSTAAMPEQDNEPGKTLTVPTQTLNESAQPFLRWVQNNNLTPTDAISLHGKLERKSLILDHRIEHASRVGKKMEDIAFDAKYLLDASIAYTNDCMKYHNQQNDGFDPASGIVKWLSRQGKLWDIGDVMHHHALHKSIRNYSHVGVYVENIGVKEPKPYKKDHEIVLLKPYMP